MLAHKFSAFALLSFCVFRFSTLLTEAFLLPSIQSHKTIKLTTVIKSGGSDNNEINGELMPEVLEGIEIHRLSVESEEEKIARYRIKGSIDGGDLKRLYGVCLNGEKRDARYPGFRKGVLPPTVMYDVKRRTLNAALKDAMVSSMDALGLSMFKEEERSIRMIEPVSIDVMVQEHELSGKDLEFVAELDAIGEVKVDLSQVKDQAFTPEGDAKTKEQIAKREARKQAEKDARKAKKGEVVSGFGN